MSIAAVLPAAQPAPNPTSARGPDSSSDIHRGASSFADNAPTSKDKDTSKSDSTFQSFLAAVLHEHLQKPVSVVTPAGLAKDKVSAIVAQQADKPAEDAGALSQVATNPAIAAFFLGQAHGQVKPTGVVGTPLVVTAAPPTTKPVKDPATKEIASNPGQASASEMARPDQAVAKIASGKDAEVQPAPAQTPQVTAAQRIRLSETTHHGLVSAKDGLAVTEQAKVGGNPNEALFTFQVAHITAESQLAGGITVDTSSHDAKATSDQRLPRERDDQATLQNIASQIRNAGAEAAPRANNPTATNGEQQGKQVVAVSDQIAGSIIARAEVTTHEGRTDFHLRLEPPELGTVRVHITSTEQGITARLVVHEEVARQLIESQLESLKQRLTNAGISLGNVNVSQDQSGSKNPRGRDKSTEPGRIEPASSRTFARLGTPRSMAALAGVGSIDVVV